MNEVICQNCQANIQVSNMTIHELYCSRNIEICTTCGVKYDINEEDEHILLNHIPKTCKYCCQYVADPKQHACPQKPTQCQFCSKQFKGNEIIPHEYICKDNQQKCKYCTKFIKNEFIKTHIAKCQIQILGHLEFACNNCGQKLLCKECINLADQLLQEHESVCKYKQFECPYCCFYLEKDEIEDHLILCGSRTEKCIFCKKLILLSQTTEHQLDCYRERLKRNLKLLKKESARLQVLDDKSEDEDYQAYLEQIQDQDFQDEEQ